MYTHTYIHTYIHTYCTYILLMKIITDILHAHLLEGAVKEKEETDRETCVQVVYTAYK